MSKKKVFIIAGVLIAILALMFALINCAPASTTEEKEVETTTEETTAVEGTEAENEQKADEEADSDKASVDDKKSSSSESKATSSSSSNKATSSSASSSKAEAAHTHSWVKHDAVYENEPVYEEKIVCSCGKTYNTNTQWENHIQSLGFGTNHSYSVKDVQVGTEKVLVSEAYYSCSCGATK